MFNCYGWCLKDLINICKVYFIITRLFVPVIYLSQLANEPYVKLEGTTFSRGMYIQYFKYPFIDTNLLICFRPGT